MPIIIPEKLIGAPGNAIITKYSDPKFAFTALTELEDVFVSTLLRRFSTFVADGELQEPPRIVPAYNPGDRSFYVVVVESQLNQIASMGLGFNKFELQYQPNPEDDSYTETYIGYEGDAKYTVELFIRTTTRYTAGYIADWVFLALMDPLSNAELRGVQFSLNNVRFTGKVQEFATPDGMDKFWGITITVGDITLPWIRLYKYNAPPILDSGLILINPVPEYAWDPTYFGADLVGWFRSDQAVMKGTEESYTLVTADGDEVVYWFCHPDMRRGIEGDNFSSPIWPLHAYRGYDEFGEEANKPRYTLNVLNGLPGIYFNGIKSSLHRTKTWPFGPWSQRAGDVDYDEMAGPLSMIVIGLFDYGNMLTNGNFDKGFTSGVANSWTRQGTWTAGIESSDTKIFNYAQKLTFSNSIGSLRQQVGDVGELSNCLVKAKVWVKASSPSVRVVICNQNNAGSGDAYVLASDYHSGSGEWELLECQVNRGTDTTGTWILIGPGAVMSGLVIVDWARFQNLSEFSGVVCDKQENFHEGDPWGEEGHYDGDVPTYTGLRYEAIRYGKTTRGLRMHAGDYNNLDSLQDFPDDFTILGATMAGEASFLYIKGVKYPALDTIGTNRAANMYLMGSEEGYYCSEGYVLEFIVRLGEFTPQDMANIYDYARRRYGDVLGSLA